MLKNLHIPVIATVLFLVMQTFLSVLNSVMLAAVFLISWVVLGIFSIKHSLFVKSTCRIRTYEKIVFLSFDDGPSVQYTPLILDTLKQKNVKALFFCIGQQVELYPQLVRRILDEGHKIGNHTYSHDWHNTFKHSGIFIDEINRTNNLLKKIIGSKTNLFRPPFGITNPSIAKALKLKELHSVGWDIRSFDTIIKKPQKLMQRISSRLRPGSIILLHDNREITSGILSELIENIREKGYQIFPWPELNDI